MDASRKRHRPVRHKEVHIPDLTPQLRRDGGTAHFVVFVMVPLDLPTITLRQIAIATATNAPALTPWSLAVLAVLLGGLGGFRLHRRKRAGGQLPGRSLS